ncbi:MAG TPA: ribosome maturation factor RimP [Acidimicrobiales bacterium]|nr:ribosome maturation factor RimP [Acidimicrobiales bacterium]
MATAADLRAVAEPVLAAAGLELWDVEVSHDVVRVLIERSGGVDLDALGAASEAISALLDGHDELVPDHAYHLEVSSPGLERTLRTPEHFRRYLGTTVTAKTSVPVGGARRHRGVLRSVGHDGIELVSDADPTGPPILLAYDQITRAATVVDWELALKGGAAAAPGDTEAKDLSR